MSRTSFFLVLGAIVVAMMFVGACRGVGTAAPTATSPPPVVETEADDTANPPALPVVHLRHGEELHDGDRGSYCWPQPSDQPGVGVAVCVDTIFLEGPTPPIRLTQDESLVVEIDAHADPEVLSAGFYEVGTTTLVHSLELQPTRNSELLLDMEPGIYTVHVNGRWDVGDIYYVFQIEVG